MTKATRIAAVAVVGIGIAWLAMAMGQTGRAADPGAAVGVNATGDPTRLGEDLSRQGGR